MQTAAVIYIVLALVIIVALFVRSRAREGVPVFKLTEKDKSDLREVRRELGIWRVLARLVGGFGSVLFIVGVSSLFYRDPAHRIDATTSGWMIGLSVVLTFCAFLLLRKDKSK
jgi:uncharacterized membrane protein YfcA